MNMLRWIWPTLGAKPPKIDGRNTSWTKKGPGRRHQYLTAKEVAARNASQMILGGI